MALTLTAPAYLPPARTGLDYALAAVQFAASGGVAPYAFTLGAGAPTGLTVGAADGRLSGVITGDCGPYSITVTVTDAVSATASVTLPLFVSALPNGLDLAKRSPVEGLKGCTIDTLNAAARAALGMIAEWTGSPIEPDQCGAPVFTDEVIPTKSFTRRAVPAYHPIQEIVKADYGTSALRVGTMRDTQSGKADIAIMPDGGAVWLASMPRKDGLGGLFLTYRAGYATLPPDLVEVFVYLANLILKERDRVGITSLAVGEATTQYFRDLPYALQAAVNNKRRVWLLV